MWSLFLIKYLYLSGIIYGVEAPITDQLRDSTPNPKKYKAKDGNHEDWNFVVILFLELRLLWAFEAKSRFEHITNV